jgi:hypothetical protein
MRKWHCELVPRSRTLENVRLPAKHLQDCRFPKKTVPTILISKMRGVKELERDTLRCLSVTGSHYQGKVTVPTGCA